MIRYAITDGVSSTTELLQHANRWAADEIDFVQLREKHLGAAELATLARSMLRVFAGCGSRTKLLINGRLDVAVAARADGVHLTSSPGELTPAQVRQVFEHAELPAPIVSVSCHTLDEVQRAHEDGVDVILFGPVFEKRGGGDVVRTGVGLDVLRQACTAAGEAKLLALGGITSQNAAACVAAGSAGIAAIRLFAEAAARRYTMLEP